jgi:hypothetical protein
MGNRTVRAMSTDKILKCPVCNRDVVPAPLSHSEADAEKARERFVNHAREVHHTSDLQALLYFAEALRRA